MPTNELSRAIVEENWSRCISLAKDPAQCKVWNTREGFFDGKTASNCLPLHEALVAHAPYEVIEAMVQSYPAGLAAYESSYKRLPLHCACRKNADPSVVAFLVNQYKAACVIADSLTRCPIHYALTNGADESIVEILVKAGPDACKSYDDRGWTPLHVAVNVGASQKVVRMIVDANPEAVLIRTDRGTSIRATAHKLQTPGHEDVEALIRQVRAEMDEKVHLPDMKKKPTLDHEVA